MKLLETLKTRAIVWVWNHTPTCAEMSRLASRRLDERPSLKTRLQMRLHFLICAWCHRYARQLRFLHAASPRLHDGLEAHSARQLAPESRRRLVERLQQEAAATGSSGAVKRDPPVA